MSLRNILRMVYCIVLVIVLLGGVAFWAVGSLGGAAKQLQLLSEEKEKVADLQLAFAQVLMPGNDYLITGSPAEKENFNLLDRNVQEKIANLQTSLNADSEKNLIGEIAQKYTGVSKLAAEILSISNPVGNSQGGKVMEDMDAKANQLSSDLEQLHSIIKQEEAATEKQVSENQRNTILLISFSSIIAIIIGVIVSLVVKSTVIKPLLTMVKISDQIAQGDLTQTINVKPKGDVGKLVETFNNMGGNLRNIIAHLADSANNVTSTSQKLTQTTDYTVRVVEQVSTAIQEVAKGASEQTAYVTSTMETVGQVNTAIQQVATGAKEQANDTTMASDMVNQMATTIQEVTTSAQNVAESAAKTTAAANKGEQAVELTIKGMGSIKNKVFETASKITELGNHSQHIGEIIQVIDDIAEQTNLLALNAAIEAARAGEHGKGFAVVADEVRKLAERSSKATKEIAVLITSIQNLTTSAVSAMEEGTSQVEEGAKLAFDAGQALKDIMQTVHDTYHQVQNISAAAEQMSASSQEVVRAVENVSAITEENTAATEEVTTASNQVAADMQSVASITEETSAAAQEVSASAQEMSASMMVLSKSTNDLSNMAGELKQVVSKFKV